MLPRRCAVLFLFGWAHSKIVRRLFVKVALFKPCVILQSKRLLGSVFMARTPPLDLAVGLELRREGCKQPLCEQIAEQIREKIQRGQLQPGDRLPSTRQLALSLAIGRSTADASYLLLLKHGLIAVRRGSGAYVCEQTGFGSVVELPPSGADSEAFPVGPKSLSVLAESFRLYCHPVPNQAEVPFAVTIPSNELAPQQLWKKISSRIARAPWQSAGDAHPQGLHALRVAIADYVRKFRAIQCDAADVIITAGTQQAINLCTQVLFNAGDLVAVEDPGYPLLSGAIESHGVRTLPIEIDDQGMDPLRLADVVQRIKGVVLTPSHQYPLGSSMPVKHRLDVVQMAARHGLWVIENDYDSELSLLDRPLASMCSLDTTKDSVIYIGTFSKMLFPSVRIGYIVAPPALTECFVGARRVADLHSSELVQTILADYMQSGSYERHIRRVCHLVKERRDCLVNCLVQHLSEYVTVLDGATGTHLTVLFKVPLIDTVVAAELKQISIESRALSPFFRSASPINGLLFGFCAFPCEQIEHAVLKVRTCFERLCLSQY